MRPLNDAPRVLAEVFGDHHRRRPADVLCIPALALSRRLPDGSRAIRMEPVCFDFAVINALGPDHWAKTASIPGSAAEAYDAGKRSHGNTEALCQQAGFRFWPVVHEVQGGMAKAADAATRTIAEAVASRELRDAIAVRQGMIARVAVVIARCSARAVAKRATRQMPPSTPWGAAVVVVAAQCAEAAADDDFS